MDLKGKTNDIRMLRLKDIAACLQVSLSTARRLSDCSDFPQPIRLGKRNIRWNEKDVNDYIERLSRKDVEVN